MACEDTSAALRYLLDHPNAIDVLEVNDYEVGRFEPEIEALTQELRQRTDFYVFGSVGQQVLPSCVRAETMRSVWNAY